MVRPVCQTTMLVAQCYTVSVWTGLPDYHAGCLVLHCQWLDWFARLPCWSPGVTQLVVGLACQTTMLVTQCYTVNGWTGLPSVCSLWLGEIVSLICNLCLSVVELSTVWADPCLRCSLHVAGTSGKPETTTVILYLKEGIEQRKPTSQLTNFVTDKRTDRYAGIQTGTVIVMATLPLMLGVQWFVCVHMFVSFIQLGDCRLSSWYVLLLRPQGLRNRWRFHCDCSF